MFLVKLVNLSLDENSIGALQEFQVEDFSHIRQTPSPNWSPRHDKAATFHHWLKTFRDSSLDVDTLDSRILDEILPCLGAKDLDEVHHIGNTSPNRFANLN